MKEISEELSDQIADQENRSLAAFFDILIEMDFANNNNDTEDNNDKNGNSDCISSYSAINVATSES